MSVMFILKLFFKISIFLLVFVSNVTDGFWRFFLFILTMISCVLIFPGSAEAYVG